MSVVGDSFSCHHIEGESSADEVTQKVCRTCLTVKRCFRLQSKYLLTQVQFFSLVKEKFETWKKHFFSSYRVAYMSVTAPAIFSPYVRPELLKWDPLYEESDV